MKNYNSLKNELLKDKEIKKEYEELGPKFDKQFKKLLKNIKKAVTI